MKRSNIFYRVAIDGNGSVDFADIKAEQPENRVILADSCTFYMNENWLPPEKWPRPSGYRLAHCGLHEFREFQKTTYHYLFAIYEKEGGDGPVTLDNPVALPAVEAKGGDVPHLKHSHADIPPAAGGVFKEKAKAITPPQGPEGARVPDIEKKKNVAESAAPTMDSPAAPPPNAAAPVNSPAGEPEGMDAQQLGDRAVSRPVGNVRPPVEKAGEKPSMPPPPVAKARENNPRQLDSRPTIPRSNSIAALAPAEKFEPADAPRLSRAPISPPDDAPVNRPAMEAKGDNALHSPALSTTSIIALLFVGCAAVLVGCYFFFRNRQGRDVCLSDDDKNEAHLFPPPSGRARV